MLQLIHDKLTDAGLCPHRIARLYEHGGETFSSVLMLGIYCPVEYYFRYESIVEAILLKYQQKYKVVYNAGLQELWIEPIDRVAQFIANQIEASRTQPQLECCERMIKSVYNDEHPELTAMLIDKAKSISVV